MATHHRVTGPRPKVAICWRVGCHEPATTRRNARFFCLAHAVGTPTRPAVSAEMVTAARLAMSRGLGLKEIAEAQGVLAADLDQALWRYIGEPTP